MDSYQIQQGRYSDDGDVSPLEESLFAEYELPITDRDVMRVDFYHPVRKDLIEEMRKVNNSLFAVMQGKVRLPLIGEIEVKGLSLERAAEKIQKAYCHLLADTEVFVRMEKRPSSKVAIIGLAENSEVEVDGKMRLLEVLSKAKILPSASLYKSYVLREGKALAVDLCRLVREGDLSQNIVLKPKDTIYLAQEKAANIAILGEVAAPKLIPVMEGKISLQEVLAEAEGMQMSADPFSIFVIRSAFSIPKIYQLTLEQVLQLPRKSMLLIPGDIVYVGSSAISDWNRWLLQIMPSIKGIENYGKAMNELKKKP